jgi:hypothetical protein
MTSDEGLMDDIQELQRDSREGILVTLVMGCRERYLRAAALLELANDDVKRVRDLYQRRFPVEWLLDPYQVLCERYRQQRYSVQMVLGEAFVETMRRHWNEFVYWWLLPKLLEDDAFVRDTLRCVEAISSVDPAEASINLKSHLREMCWESPS